MDKGLFGKVNFEVLDHTEGIDLSPGLKALGYSRAHHSRGTVSCTVEIVSGSKHMTLHSLMSVVGLSVCSQHDEFDNLYGCVLSFKRALEHVKNPPKNLTDQYKKMKKVLWKRTSDGSLLRAHL